MRPGLAAKLALLLACIGILASGMTGYYAWSANQRLLVAEAGRNLGTSAELMTRHLASEVHEASVDVVTLAALPMAWKIVSLDRQNPQGDLAQMAQFATAVMEQHPDFLQLRLITAQQHGLEVLRLDRDGPRVLRIEGDGLQEKGHFPYVFETLAGSAGQVYVSPIAVNHEAGAHSAEGQPSLRLAMPIINPAGQAVGVVVINIDLHRLILHLQQDLPGGYALYLANARGDFLVHPDPTMTFGFDRGRHLLVQDSYPGTRALFSGSNPTVILNGLDDPQQAGDRILSFVRTPFGLPAAQQFLVLGLARPLREVLGSGNSLGRSIVQMVLAFSVLAIVLAVIFARAVTRPLQMLTHAALRFSEGHAQDRLPVDRSDEIGLLARCFDRMRKEIRTQLDVLYRTQQELSELARHDGLTKLANRTEFFRELEMAITAARCEGEALAVLFVDLDRFKEVNDRYGHALGDQLLVAVARRLREALPEQDVIGRLGGDEFIVLIRSPRLAQAIPGIAEKILAALNGSVALGARAVAIGASVGISRFPQDGQTAEELVGRADAAMYEAKAAGRNTWRYYQTFRDQSVEPV
jgi:diguanylate cyclase (GGDEF)-like protein